jgi:CHAT domain-containing protein/Flp pilus assembly protein TadD
MNLPQEVSRSILRLLLWAVSLPVVMLAGSLDANAQSVMAPFTPPPSAPGIIWPQEALKKLKLMQDYMDREAKKGHVKEWSEACGGIGDLYYAISDWNVALVYDEHALNAANSINEPRLEAAILNNIGNVYTKLGREKEAGSSFETSLALSAQLLSSPTIQSSRDLEIKTQHLRASALIDLGALQVAQVEYQKALESFTQALSLSTWDGDPAQQAHALIGLGIANHGLGNYEKAFDLLKQSVSMCAQNHDDAGEAGALVNLANIYITIGQYASALENLQKALLINRELHYRIGEARALADISIAQWWSNTRLDAVANMNQAMQIFHDLGEKDNESSALMALGYATSELGDQPKALDYYAKALALAKEVGNRDVEANVFALTGRIYDHLGTHDKALEYYNEALPIFTAYGNSASTAGMFYCFFLHYKDSDPALAIFYGKQTINYLEVARKNIKSINTEAQESFLNAKTFEGHPMRELYHSLADLLIRQGRLPEAEQILDLLKTQEYSDYILSPTPNPSPSDVSAVATIQEFNKKETQANEDFRKTTENLASLGEQWDMLRKIATRTPEQENQYQDLSGQLTEANRQMSSYYSRMYTLFGKNEAANNEVAEVKGNVENLQQLIKQMPHTVGLYTIVTAERYGVIVVTGTTTAAREFPIGEDALNKKIEAFTRTLRDRHKDPVPQAVELYQIIVGPIAADLEAAKATTLMWVLDGKLRYLPISSLHDGKQYLVQKYDSVNILPVSIPHLSEKPDLKQANALAMGISRQYDPELDPLPAVTAELHAIVKGPQSSESQGAFPGTILMDQDFTERAMEHELSGRHSIVHIASHFVFRPGDDSQSFLLLAGKEKGDAGYHLTVADFRDDQQLTLDNTELLTLSACDTGSSGIDGDGREVDGLAATAQNKGAKAVISSLWDVNDDSTSYLMSDFYRRWTTGNGSVTKIEALRQAQIDLLTGKVKPKGSAAAGSFSHPYYWASFVLSGNWL